MKSILALDLGTKCGWAAYSAGQRCGGTWILATPEEITKQRATGGDRTGDVRFARMISHLSDIKSKLAPDLVLFEDVQFSTTVMQTQLWSTFRAAIWATFPQSICRGVPVGTLKLYATGHGNATKLMMGAYLVKKHPDIFAKRDKSTKTCNVKTSYGRPVDDNECDAQHLLDYGIENPQF
jgi:hypothetical protein